MSMNQHVSYQKMLLITPVCVIHTHIFLRGSLKDPFHRRHFDLKNTGVTNNIKDAPVTFKCLDGTQPLYILLLTYVLFSVLQVKMSTMKSPVNAVVSGLDNVTREMK